LNKKFTLKELAELTNTSINTVSRALNAKQGVSDETREMIMRVAAEHNYRPNLLARSMRGSNTNLLGIIVGDISNSFFIKVLEGIEEIANKENMTIAIGNSNENIEKERKNADVFLSYNCAGLAISPVADGKSIISKLMEEEVNFVVFDRPLPEGIQCDHVGINNENDSFRAVEYLITCGHRDIAIINSYSQLKTEQDRLSGYKMALQKYHIPIQEHFIKFCEDKIGAYRACKEIIELKNRPTAIFVAKESLGLDVIAALSDSQICIPDDISILLYGDPEWAIVFAPKLTCMQRPIREMGQLGASILINRTKNKDSRDSGKYKNIVLDSKLMIRESVRILM